MNKPNSGSQEEVQTEAAKRLANVFYPPRNIVCTEPFSRFLQAYHANLDFFFFIIGVVSRADETRVVASKALLPGAKSSEERARYEESITNDQLLLKQLTKHSTVTSQNLTNGAVNAFQRYFSAIVQAVAQKRPEVLASSQVVKVDDVLRFSRHADVVAFIIDRKVNELSYGGLNDMEKYFDDHLGVRMFESDEQRTLLRLFIEVRNINVHNGGFVNEIFVSRVGRVAGFPYSKGERFHVDMDHLVRLSENAMSVALNIDATVSAKFRLQRKRHTVWIKPAKKR